MVRDVTPALAPVTAPIIITRNARMLLPNATPAGGATMRGSVFLRINAVATETRRACGGIIEIPFVNECVLFSSCSNQSYPISRNWYTLILIRRGALHPSILLL